MSSTQVPEAKWPNYKPSRLNRRFTVLMTNSPRSVPELQGDYAKTVFLMMYAKGALPISKPYPQYLLYECGIKDAVAYREFIHNEGLIVEPDVNEILLGMKVESIKSICASLGISQTGTKAVIIDRLISEIPYSNISKLLPSEKAFTLSEDGKIFLQKHEAYQILHRNPNWQIDWKEYDQQHKEDETPYETMLRIVQACLDKEKYNFVRNDFHVLSEIYDGAGNTEKSTEMLLYVQYLDLSGMCSFDGIKLYRERKSATTRKIDDRSEMLINNYTFSTFAPAITERIAERRASITIELLQKVTSWNLPINACSSSEFCRIVLAICDGTIDTEQEEMALRNHFIKIIG